MTAFLYLVMIRDYMYEHLADADRRARDVHLRPHRRARARPARRLAHAPRRDPRPVRGLRRPRARPGRPQPHLHRPHARRRRASPPPTRSTTATPARSCARPARRATCARTRRTSPTPSSTSTCRSASRATTTTATSCGCARWTSRCYMIRQLDRTCCPAGPINVDDRRCVLPGEGARLHRDRVADQPLQAGDGRAAGARRRGLQRARGAQRRARLLPRQHRRAACRRRCTCRAPSFVHMGGVHKMLDGYQLADIVPTFGSVNMIGGECDR